MPVVRVHRFGNSDALSLDEVPLPEPKGEQIVLRIDAASVNPSDFKIRAGKFPSVDEGKLPYPMGRDASGIVERCGNGVRNAVVGDAIFAMSGTGQETCVDCVILKPSEYGARPKSLDSPRPADVPLGALTAWQWLFDHGGLANGQRVLIHGGAGGVGHMAVQFARHADAYVMVIASSDDLEFVRQLGADEAIDYRGEPFEQRVKDVDLVFDLIGGDTRERSPPTTHANAVVMYAAST